MQPLYKISEQLKKFESMEGEIDEQTFADTMESLDGDMQVKCASVAMFVKSQNDEVDFIDSEIKRLTERKKRVANKASNIKEYLRVHMAITDTRKVSNGVITASLRKGVLSLVIDGKAPAQFTSVVETEKVDKRGITAAMKDGAEFDNCELVRGEDSLIIK